MIQTAVEWAPLLDKGAGHPVRPVGKQRIWTYSVPWCIVVQWENCHAEASHKEIRFTK